jgi:hypothetical protein
MPHSISTEIIGESGTWCKKWNLTPCGGDMILAKKEKEMLTSGGDGILVNHLN